MRLREKSLEFGKFCAHCETWKPRHEFGRSSVRFDGMSAYCLECRATLMREARAADPAKSRAVERERYQRNREKHFAKVAVSRALKSGKIIKPPRCPVCFEKRKIEAHHDHGYERKDWLRVAWRCRSCHHAEHHRANAA